MDNHTLTFEGINIRALRINGDPWFVLVDVCVALDISTPASAVGRLSANEKNWTPIQTASGVQDMTIINEMGLWSLVMTSRKPSAQRFKAWLVSVAIPAIHADQQVAAPTASAVLTNPPPTPMTVFAFEGLDVRITDRAGDPWFVLADVCRVLQIALPHRAADRLDDDEKAKVDMSVAGVTIATGAKINDLGVGSGNNDAWIINESGLYSLILTSRKPASKRFKKWVTADILPTIRKTGSYGAAAQPINLNDPAQLRALLLSYSTEAETTKKALAVAQTEASTSKNALDRIAGTEGTFTATQAAKDLQVRRSHLLDYMRRNRWLYRPRGCADDLPYQERIESGYLTLKVEVLPRDDGSEKVVQRARITAKGLTKLAQVVPGARHIGGNDAR